MLAMTNAGFKRPIYAEILQTQLARAQELFGVDTDVSEQSALGKFIRLGVYDLSVLYEDMEEVYLSRFPHMATGVHLDRLTPFAGLRRNNAAAAVHRVQFSGQAGSVVSFGTLISTPLGVSFRTEQEATLDETGHALCNASCTELGTVGNVSSDAICVLSQPQAGVLRVLGLSLEQAGQDVESDDSLRRRFDEAVLGTACSTADAVRGAVLRVPGVRACIVTENDTSADSATLPAHSFMCHVLESGASDTEIAHAIYEKKPLGVRCHGEVETEILGADGEMHTLRFSRVAKKELHARATLHTNTYFPQNGIDMIKSLLSDYVCARMPGEDLSQTSLYTVLYGVPGVTEAVALALSEDNGATYHTSKLFAGPSEVLWLNAENVSVEVSQHDA